MKNLNLRSHDLPAVHFIEICHVGSFFFSKIISYCYLSIVRSLSTRSWCRSYPKWKIKLKAKKRCYFASIWSSTNWTQKSRLVLFLEVTVEPWCDIIHMPYIHEFCDVSLINLYLFVVQYSQFYFRNLRRWQSKYLRKRKISLRPPVNEPCLFRCTLSSIDWPLNRSRILNRHPFY